MKKTAWAERIADLQAAGLTISEIGEEIGLAPSTVYDLQRGASKSPRGEAALKLHDLHRKKCRRVEGRVAGGT